VEIRKAVIITKQRQRLLEKHVELQYHTVNKHLEEAQTSSKRH